MPSPCVECNTTYKDHKSLLRHQKTKHGNEVFKCENCPFTCNRKDSLMRHIQKYHIQSYKGRKRKRNHHDARSVLLSEIPNLVEDSESEDDDDEDSDNEDDNLETHPPKKSNIDGAGAAIHTEPEKEKETPMDIDPIKKHTFKCQKCTFRSIHRKEFEEHIRTAHQVENAFKCSTCGVLFNQGYNSNKHVLNKHTDKNLKCSICPYRTNDRPSLS